MRELREYAKLRRFNVVHEFVDEGVSSRKAKRPELDKLLALARRRAIDVVLVWRFDRFARSMRELILALDDFRALEIDFISLRESLDTSTPTGRVLFTMIAAMAEFEREINRQRVLAGIENARRKGKRLGRPRYFIDIPLARRLREEGKSWSVIAKQLGIPASTIRSRLKKLDAMKKKPCENPPSRVG